MAPRLSHPVRRAAAARSVVGALAAFVAVLATAATEAEEGPREDLLTLAHGAVVARASVDAERAIGLLDGNADRGWNNLRPKDHPPYALVFELLAPTTLDEVVVDTAGPRPGGAAGAAARTVEIAASSESPDGGFVVLGTVDVAEDGIASLQVQSATRFRWLRFTITANHGHPQWTYLDEVMAYGSQIAVPDDDGRYTGAWESNFGPIELVQTGAQLAGCYRDGTFVGSVSGGVARVAWHDAKNPKVNGTALFVVDARRHLTGVQYRGPGRARWGGPPATATTPKTACATSAPPANPIGAALAARGAVELYGIHFDFDSDVLQPRSEPVLQSLAEVLRGDGGVVTVAGHTDDVGGDAYNLDLSRRRAEAVVAWLGAHGVERARLHALGRGEGDPVADNSTADGRALNRRVTVTRGS